MTETSITYQLHAVVEDGSTYLHGVYDSEMLAKLAAQNLQDREAVEYKIFAVVKTVSLVDIFTIPAYVPTLDEIAETIAEDTEGSRGMVLNEDYERLNEADKQAVREKVAEKVCACNHCGEYNQVAYMESYYGDEVCSDCANRIAEEEEEEDED